MKHAKILSIFFGIVAIFALLMVIGCQVPATTVQLDLTPVTLPVVIKPAESPTPIPGGSVQFTVDSGESVYLISPYVYGTNMPDWDNYSCTITRLGGNRWTAYNWETNASNAGSDWYYSNDNYLGGGDIPGEVIRLRVQAAFDGGGSTIVTVPIAGHVSADKNGSVDLSDPNHLEERFHLSHPMKGSAFANPPNLNDDHVYQDEFIDWLMSEFPDATSSEDNKLLFSLDNEPALWASTHEEIHPVPVTYAELLSRTIAYANGIKDVASDATILGFVGYGFNAFENLQGASDANQHGNFINYFLSQLKADEDANGRRLVDVLDLHWYSEVRVNGVRVTEDDNSPAMVAARVQAPRSLWDPTYVEDSWIANDYLGGPIALFPRVQQQIADNYPGTKLSLSEYNHGGANHISGAVSQADVLGIFGREQVFAATLWDITEDTAFHYAAFDMFRNFDGNDSRFGDTHISAETTDIEATSIYASVDNGNDERMVLVAVNRSDVALEANISIQHSTSFSSARIFELTEAVAAPQSMGSVQVANDNTFTRVLPAMSVVTIELTP